MAHHRASMLPSTGGGGGGPRQSLYPGASLGGAGMSMAGPSSQARLQAKQAELEGLRALRDHSARMVREMERLSEKVDGLVDGGDAVASVLSQWEGVFRAIQIARASASFVSPPLQYHNPGMVIDTGEEEDSASEGEIDGDEEGERRGGPVVEKRVLLDTVVRLPINLDGLDDADASATTATAATADDSGDGSRTPTAA